MKRIVFILIYFSLTFSVLSQEKKFTMEDVVFNSYTSLAPTTLKQLKWLPNEYSYSFIEEDDDNIWLVKGFATSGKKAQLLTLNKLADALDNYNIKAPKKFPTITWIDDLNFYFKQENKLFTYSVENNDLELRATFPNEAK